MLLRILQAIVSFVDFKLLLWRPLCNCLRYKFGTFIHRVYLQPLFFFPCVLNDRHSTVIITAEWAIRRAIKLVELALITFVCIVVVGKDWGLRVLVLDVIHLPRYKILSVVSYEDLLVCSLLTTNMTLFGALADHFWLLFHFIVYLLLLLQSKT